MRFMGLPAIFGALMVGAAAFAFTHAPPDGTSNEVSGQGGLMPQSASVNQSAVWTQAALTVQDPVTLRMLLNGTWNSNSASTIIERTPSGGASRWSAPAIIVLNETNTIISYSLFYVHNTGIAENGISVAVNAHGFNYSLEDPFGFQRGSAGHVNLSMEFITTLDPGKYEVIVLNSANVARSVWFQPGSYQMQLETGAATATVWEATDLRNEFVFSASEGYFTEAAAGATQNGKATVESPGIGVLIPIVDWVPTIHAHFYYTTPDGDAVEAEIVRGDPPRYSYLSGETGSARAALAVASAGTWTITLHKSTCVNPYYTACGTSFLLWDLSGDTTRAYG